MFDSGYTHGSVQEVATSHSGHGPRCLGPGIAVLMALSLVKVLYSGGILERRNVKEAVHKAIAPGLWMVEAMARRYPKWIKMDGY